MLRERRLVGNVTCLCLLKNIMLLVMLLVQIPTQPSGFCCWRMIYHWVQVFVPTCSCTRQAGFQYFSSIYLSKVFGSVLLCSHDPVPLFGYRFSLGICPEFDLVHGNHVTNKASPHWLLCLNLWLWSVLRSAGSRLHSAPGARPALGKHPA